MSGLALRDLKLQKEVKVMEDNGEEVEGWLQNE